MRHRIPWTSPSHPHCPPLNEDHTVLVSLGDPWGQVVAIAHAMSHHDRLVVFDHATGRATAGSIPDVIDVESTTLPIASSGDGIVCDSPLGIAERLAPGLFAANATADVNRIRSSLLDAVYLLGHTTEQREYEQRHDALRAAVREYDAMLDERRFLGGDAPGIADALLFAFSVRLDSVYYELFKATIGLLDDFPNLAGHARDLYERQPFWSTTDFDAIKRHHYLFEPVTNPKQIVPAGGCPDLDAPHFRSDRFDARSNDDAVEEDQSRERAHGEWVRPPSEERAWIRADGDGEYPAESGRYHLYAPYNCPWSHRALLGRSVLGLEGVVDASIVYFRRDPDRGWQFNPEIPGCTADRANGVDYVAELYESVGSDERSVPLLWDTKTDTIVSNESADILRMFSTEFDELRERDIDLYPQQHRSEIDRLNGEVYQRINNGAYKAGFASSQAAYERAFHRYFRALRWLDGLLSDRRWLAGSEQPTEADLRLYPTLFRHDAVYYSRFKLNAHRLGYYPQLSRWLARMHEVPGVSEASDLDHSRNGYFGRTGNEVVPAGPVPLGFSPADFAREVWLNR